jgi:crotonobetainyl-CoA:carnitine CoA-transferase CaiB-like acyl-CoA transferase
LGIIEMRLGYEVLNATNPKIIMCSISALGQTGPLADDARFDFIGQAYAGITSLIGEEHGPPYMPMVEIGDVSAGAYAMGAIACALLHREEPAKVNTSTSRCLIRISIARPSGCSSAAPTKALAR